MSFNVGSFDIKLKLLDNKVKTPCEFKNRVIVNFGKNSKDLPNLVDQDICNNHARLILESGKVWL